MPESKAQNQVLPPTTNSSLVTRKPRMERVPEKIVNLTPEILEAGTKMGIGDAGNWRGN